MLEGLHRTLIILTIAAFMFVIYDTYIYRNEGKINFKKTGLKLLAAILLLVASFYVNTIK